MPGRRSPRVGAAAVLELLEVGWAVFPVYEPGQDGACSCGRNECASPAKHPRVAGGFKSASGDPAVVQEWLRRWPAMNIGVATGAAGLLVLDVDPRHGGGASLEALEREHGELPRTVQTVTGSGGQHIIFRAPTAPISSRAGALGQGLDIRGRGGYIVAPGSRHVAGGLYVWAPLCSPREVELADPPAWLVALLVDGPRAQETSSDRRLPAGTRNQALTSLAGTMRRRGLGERAMLAALLEHNVQQCDPPLDDDEVRSIASSVATYPAGREQSAPSAEGAVPGRRAVVRALVDVEHEPITWLWDGRIATGAVTVLAGHGGLGKSTLAMWLAARVSRGDLSGDLRGRGRDVVIVTAEDHVESVVRGRAQAAEAELRRVHVLEVHDEYGPAALDLARDAEHIEEAVAQVKPALLVLDPYAALIGGRVDTGRDNQVRAALGPVERLARRHDLAAVVVAHLKKSDDAEPLLRVSGAGLGNAGRGLLLFDRNPDPDAESRDDHDDPRRVLAHAKNNLGPLAPSLAVRIEERAVHLGERSAGYGVVVFEGEIALSARDLGSRPDARELSAVAQAEEWLHAHLIEHGGEAASSDVHEAARKAGHARRTVQDAGAAMARRGVLSQDREGFPARTIWRLVAAARSPVARQGFPGVRATARKPTTSAIPGPPDPKSRELAGDARLAGALTAEEFVDALLADPDLGAVELSAPRLRGVRPWVEFQRPDLGLPLLHPTRERTYR